MHDSNKYNFDKSLSSCRGPNGVAIALSSSTAANISQELILCTQTHSIGSTLCLGISIGHKIICVLAIAFSWACCSISWAATDISSSIFWLVETNHIIWRRTFRMTSIVNIVFNLFYKRSLVSIEHHWRYGLEKNDLLTWCRSPHGSAITISSCSTTNVTQKLVLSANRHPFCSTFCFSIGIGYKIAWVSTIADSVAINWTSGVSWTTTYKSSWRFWLIESYDIIWCIIFRMTTIIHVVVCF